MTDISFNPPTSLKQIKKVNDKINLHTHNALPSHKMVLFRCEMHPNNVNLNHAHCHMIYAFRLAPLSHNLLRDDNYFICVRSLTVPFVPKT